MKTIYIIPGLGEKCDLVRYKKLAHALTGKGYEIKPVNPNWYRPLSENVFPVKKDDIVIGFSFGAVIAYLIAKKYPCKKVILASISPIHEFSFESLVKDYRTHMKKDLAIEIAKDIKQIKISLKTLKVPYVTLMGEREHDLADFLVPKTEHEINSAYIRCIEKFV